MAERSKAPDSRATTLRSNHWSASVLVHECGRGFESHFWQIFFVVFFFKMLWRVTLPYDQIKWKKSGKAHVSHTKMTFIKRKKVLIKRKKWLGFVLFTQMANFMAIWLSQHLLVHFVAGTPKTTPKTNWNYRNWLYSQTDLTAESYFF